MLIKTTCAGVATLLLLEFGLRIVGFRPVSAPTTTLAASDLHPDADISAAQRKGWLPPPNEQRTVEPLPDGSPGRFVIRRNRLSLREDADTPIEPAADVVRVLCLGDSHTDGVCDNVDSYPHLFQRMWNDAESPSRSATTSGDDTKRRPPDASATGHDEVDRGVHQRRRLGEATPIEVLNAGWATSSPYQQYWAFEQVYRRLRPDLVCVGFYAGNDFVDLMRSADAVHLERQGERWAHREPSRSHDSTQTTHSPWESLKTPFRRYSATYTALTQVRWLRSKVVDAVGDTYRDRLEQAQRAHAGAVWQNLNQAYYFRHHPEKWPEAVEQQRYILEQYLERSQRDDFDLLLLVIPAMRQIHAETDERAFAESIGTLELAADDVATDDRACDAVVEIAENLGISYVDLREPLRQAWQAQSATPLYYRVDQHLNVAGNRIVAAALKKALAP